MIKRLTPMQLVELYKAQVICDEHNLAISCITMIRIYDSCGVINYENPMLKKLNLINVVSLYHGTQAIM